MADLVERFFELLGEHVISIFATLAKRDRPSTRNSRWASKLPLGLTWEQLSACSGFCDNGNGQLTLDTCPRPREKARKKDTETSSEAACQVPLGKRTARVSLGAWRCDDPGPVTP